MSCQHFLQKITVFLQTLNFDFLIAQFFCCREKKFLTKMVFSFQKLKILIKNIFISSTKAATKN
jgi:hypothetical protein